MWLDRLRMVEKVSEKKAEELQVKLRLSSGLPAVPTLCRGRSLGSCL